MIAIIVLAVGWQAMRVNWRRHWAYLIYVLRHKWFVLLAAIELGVPIWGALIHDWDKFLPASWIAYAETFYAPNGGSQYAPTTSFDRYWLRHQNIQPHHWQYWLIAYDNGNTKVLPMPDRYRREMLADWIGAGRALGKPDTLAWYTSQRDNIKVHPQTRVWLDEQLGWEPRNAGDVIS